jgi:hypothetical protein
MMTSADGPATSDDKPLAGHGSVTADLDPLRPVESATSSAFLNTRSNWSGDSGESAETPPRIETFELAKKIFAGPGAIQIVDGCVERLP